MLKRMLITIIIALGGPAPYNLVSVEDAFDWSSGSKGPRIGSYYTVLRRADMEKQKVLVRDSAPIVDAETVTQYTTGMRFIQVDFDGFSASVYADRTGNLRISASAEAVRVVSPQTSSGKKEG